MNRIMAEGAFQLATALKFNTSLDFLSLGSGNKIGNNRNRIMEVGALHLSQALRVNKFLTILNISGNSIGNEGLSYILVAMLENQTIVDLDLSNNEITGAGFT